MRKNLLDKRLKKFAKDNGVHYTRYADDMSFSSMYNAFRPNKRFMKKLRGIIEEQHFVLNESKTRIQKQNKHQEVTGIVVNEKLNVSRKYVRDLRQILYIWWKYGYETALNNMIQYIKTGDISKITRTNDLRKRIISSNLIQKIKKVLQEKGMSCDEYFKYILGKYDKGKGTTHK